MSILLDTRQVHSIGSQLLHLPFGSHMIYYNILRSSFGSPTAQLPVAAAAMFDLISSKLSSVSTENTSVSFPASLSVSRLLPRPSIYLSLAGLFLHLVCCVPLLDFAFYFQTTQVTHLHSSSHPQTFNSSCVCVSVRVLLLDCVFTLAAPHSRPSYASDSGSASGPGIAFIVVVVVVGEVFALF